METITPSRVLSCCSLRSRRGGRGDVQLGTRRALQTPPPPPPPCYTTVSGAGNLRTAHALRSSFIAPSVGGFSRADFCGQKLRVPSLSPSAPGRGGNRSVVTMVIPYSGGSAYEQPPPDLPSYLLNQRIVYLGLPFIPAVTELILAQFLYLIEEEDPKKPIYLYINSTGTMKGDRKLGYETEAFAMHDMIRMLDARLHTLCVGNAWAEAAILLAMGEKGHRAALPSASIMLRQPFTRYQGQATNVESACKAATRTKKILIRMYAYYIGKSDEQIEKDIRRPKYFSPSEAVEYGIIDKVLYTERTAKERSAKV